MLLLVKCYPLMGWPAHVMFWVLEPVPAKVWLAMAFLLMLVFDMWPKRS